jgi:hypothetical protein
MMEAKIADHVWEIEEPVARLDWGAVECGGETRLRILASAGAESHAKWWRPLFTQICDLCRRDFGGGPAGRCLADVGNPRVDGEDVALIQHE